MSFALITTRMLEKAFNDCDVAADGKRFLIGTMTGESTSTPRTVILNGTADSKK